MEFNKYYQDELSFLREMGREFARAYPALAPMLADRGSDPDVERLLEGFAFLTGRIRQKLDDEFPELIHAMMNLLWPHYLRPVPSMTMLEFMPVSGAVRNRQKISRGVEVASLPVEGTPCRFRTAFDVDLFPVTLEQAGLETAQDGRSSLRLKFSMNPGTTLKQAGIESLRLHFAGDPAYSLYLWVSRYVSDIKIVPVIQGKAGQPLMLPASIIRPVGFSRDEALLPYPETSFAGYRLIQEYFSFPEKFLFIELSNLQALFHLPVCDSFEAHFIFSRPPLPSLRVTSENVRLFCTPAVNLFPRESDPVRVTHDRVEYRLRPAGSNPLHYEIYSVDQAFGWVRGTVQEQEYEPFYSFNHGSVLAGSQASYYQTRLKNAVAGDGTETYVSFVNGEQKTVVPPTETVLFRLHCTNRMLAGKLRAGDIQTPTESSPEFARFRNLTRVTPSIRLPMGGDLYWRLISHLSLNYISLSSVQSLRGILDLYNFQSFFDRQAGRANERRLEGIQKVQSEAEDFLFHGVPVRGTAVFLEMLEDHFAGEGDMFLFTSILNEFFSLYASLNSYTRLTVKGIQQGEIYQWKPTIGRQIIF